MPSGRDQYGIVRVGDAGVHNVEGSVSGALATKLSKQREIQVANYESQRDNIIHKSQSQVKRFQSQFKDSECADAHKVAETVVKPSSSSKNTSVTKKRKNAKISLSFCTDDTEENIDGALDVKKKKLVSKDPTAATAFLPDRERDAQIEARRRELEQEWLDDQKLVQKQKLEVVYSYWDGSGHRKTLTLEKGTSIETFLIMVRDQCSEEFRELRAAPADSLMYIKEDLIIPHHLSFYDLIITKARGKSGPLFHFDVHDAIVLMTDASVEKDESHPGKVCLRAWYEKNKHIFPASRWEVYDPKVLRANKYTIHGK